MFVHKGGRERKCEGRQGFGGEGGMYWNVATDIKLLQYKFKLLQYTLSFLRFPMTMGSVNETCDIGGF